jgi:hypothetical protein
MKHLRCLISFVALLTVPRAEAATSAATGCEPEYRPVVIGLDYAHIQTTNQNSGEPWSIHIARMDRAQKDLGIAETLAHHQIFGTAPVSAIARAFPKEQGEPLAAINAGFCIRTKDPYQGAPRGIGKGADSAMVIVEGEVIGAPSKYSFWVNEDRSLHFGTFDSRFTASLPDGVTIPIGLNTECKPEGVMLYTHILGPSTRATNRLEVVLEDPSKTKLSWHIGESSVMRVKEINPSGNTPLTPATAVLSFGGKMAGKAGSLRPGDKIKVELKTAPELTHVVTACHAIFPIVKSGKALETFDTSGAMLHRNPRTAIGFNSKYFFMVVVDGRQKEISMGMNARELAQFMAQLGCDEAMNLDGGGSSTFWLQGKTRNSVPGGKERDRADALVIVQSPQSQNAKSAAPHARQ